MATQRAYNNSYENQALTQSGVRTAKVSPRAKVHRQVILWAIVFTVAALFLLSRHAELDDTSRQLRNITVELNAIEQTNQHLQRQIDRSINLIELEQRAIEEFGMRRIERHQILDIDMNMNENVGEIISRRSDNIPLDEGILYGVPGVLIRAIQTMR